MNKIKKRVFNGTASMAALFGLMVAAMPAHAQYATGGAGQYRDQIYWFDWGNAGASVPQTGTTVTNTIMIAGQPLAIICSLSGISGNGPNPDLNIYQPGSYFEDGLDNLYNIGGSGTANSMDIGIRNRTAATEATFTYSCSATLGGNPYVLDGLVFADAETTNRLEFIRTTLPAGTAMRVIERYRGDGCTTGYNVNLTGSTYEFTSLSPYTCYVPGNPEPAQANAMGVYFIDNTSSLTSIAATITFGSGGGNEAVAVGVMLNAADFGDAPSSYGDAAHIVQQSWNGGTLTAGNTNIFSSGFTLASLQAPATAVLGSLADVEGAAWASAGATGDDSNGTDDEDGVASLTALSVSSSGLPYTVAVSCVGTAPIAGWIDFNRNGTFDAGERSNTVNCSGGGATLQWTVPTNIVAGQTYLRVRTAVNATEIANPTGLATTGETEDYALTIQSQPDFGTCDARMFLSQSPNNTTNTSLYNINTAANPLVFSLAGQGTAVYNASGYNPVDNYVYAISYGSTASNSLIRVGSDGSTANLGAVTGLPTDFYNAGDFSPAGVYYVIGAGNGAENRLYAIDVNTRTATLVTMSASIQPSDIAWVNGLLYAVDGTGQLYSINPTSGAVTPIGSPAGSIALGAMFGAPNGLFGSANGGGFYQIDLLTGARTLISGSPSATVNDGAHCPTANIIFPTDVSVTKTNTPAQGPNDLTGDTYVPGETRVYTVVVTNNGQFGAQNVTVSDPVPSGIDASTISWTCTSTSGGAVCGAASGTGALNDTGLDLPITLDGSNNIVPSVATYTVTMTVPSTFTGDLVNTVTVSLPPANTDPTPANNTATDTDTQATANLAITKTSTPNGPFTAGQTISYTVTATNNGPSSADGSFLYDPAVPGLDCTTVTSCTPAGGAACPASPTVSGLQTSPGLAVPTFPSGGSVTFVLSCEVTATGQ